MCPKAKPSGSKGMGRLIFAGGGGFTYDSNGGNLIWIIRNSNEPGYR